MRNVRRCVLRRFEIWHEWPDVRTDTHLKSDFNRIFKPPPNEIWIWISCVFFAVQISLKSIWIQSGCATKQIWAEIWTKPLISPFVWGMISSILMRSAWPLQSLLTFFTCHCKKNTSGTNAQRSGTDAPKWNTALIITFSPVHPHTGTHTWSNRPQIRLELGKKHAGDWVSKLYKLVWVII